MTTAIRADVFPAELLGNPDAPDPADRTRVYPVRVVVTLDEVLVFKDAGRRPELVFRDRLVSYSPPPGRRAPLKDQKSGAARWAVLTTDSGHALSFARSSGCGCGSRLKAMSTQTLLALDAEKGDPMPSAASTRDS